jgi:tetratricopeptide (TPR) repeat protein
MGKALLLALAVTVVIVAWPGVQSAWMNNWAGIQVLHAASTVLQLESAMAPVTRCGLLQDEVDSTRRINALSRYVKALRNISLPATASRATLYTSMTLLSGDAELIRLALHDLPNAGQRKQMLAFRLGCTLASQGNEEAAIDLWSEAGLASVVALHGSRAYYEGDSASAEILLAWALEVYDHNPTWLTDTLTLGETLKELGRLYWERGNYALTSTMLKRALAADPSDVTAWLILGESECQLGNESTCIAALQEAILRPGELWPRNHATTLLATLYSKQHKWDAAIGVLRQGISIDPDAAQHHVALADLYQNTLQQPLEATAVLEQGLATVTSTSSRAHLLGFLGYYLAQQGRYAEAGERFQEAFAIDPESPYWATWAWWTVHAAVSTDSLDTLRAQMLAVAEAGGNQASREILKAIAQAEGRRP